jgi:hypothetical protein
MPGGSGRRGGEVEEAVAELVFPVLMDGVAVFPVAFVAVVFVLVFMISMKQILICKYLDLKINFD